MWLTNAGDIDKICLTIFLVASCVGLWYVCEASYTPLQIAMNILIAGATGYIGRRVVPELVSAGHSVTCTFRERQAPDLPGTRAVRADALERETLLPALANVDVAYYLIRSRQQDSIFEEHDRPAAINFANAAKTAGVRRIVYLGELVSESGGSSAVRRSREIGVELRCYGPPVTEFRTAGVIGSGSRLFEVVRYLGERLPVVVCPRWMRRPLRPIAISDLARYLAAAAAESRCVGGTVEVGGATEETLGSMISGYAKLRGLKRLFLRAPLALTTLSTYLVDAVLPASYPGTRGIIEALGDGGVCDLRKARELFPGIQPLSYSDAIKVAVNRDASAHTRCVLRPESAQPKHLVFRREGFIFGQWETLVDSEPAAVFSVLEGIGGQRGWLFADELWQFRGLLDQLVGGVGLRRGRRDPDVLEVGDYLDFWRVEAVDRPRRIRLRAEMKVPGRAWLQFEVNGQPTGHTLLRMTVIFEPRGVIGEAYWAVLYPIHVFVFDGMHQAIASAARRSGRAVGCAAN
jgi:uncharacterized protein YbjT (DUF2867 family)